ncbi:MAG: hypothetical protein PHX30_01130 [Candidatus Pacebacteria bacterium]|jgi:hypothetical protein|nr:hypothetical protein [Candidatus Paceibacterota bacterium]
MAKKEYEGLYEKYLNLFMPIWLTLEGIKMMRKEKEEEKRKKEERGNNR